MSAKDKIAYMVASRFCLGITLLFPRYIHNISTSEHRQILKVVDSKQMMAQTWDRPRILVGDGRSSDPPVTTGGS